MIGFNSIVQCIMKALGCLFEGKEIHVVLAKFKAFLFTTFLVMSILIFLRWHPDPSEHLLFFVCFAFYLLLVAGLAIFLAWIDRNWDREWAAAVKRQPTPKVQCDRDKA